MDEEDLAQEQGQPPDSEEEEEERRRAAGEGSSVEAPAGGSWQMRGSLGGRSKRSAALDGAEEDEEDGYFNHALPRDGVRACPAPARPPARPPAQSAPRRRGGAAPRAR